MAAQPLAKRQMLSRMLSVSGINRSNLAAVLSMTDIDATAKELAAAENRNDAVEEEVVKLPLSEGGEFLWPVVLPHSWLTAASKTSGLGEILAAALRTTPSSVAEPWRLVLYQDEITPGNPLRPDNKRKISAFYASFCELGQALCCEDSWFFLGAIRSSVAKTVQGGMSGVVRFLLRAMFLGPRSLKLSPHDLGGDADKRGFAAALADGTIVFVKFHRLLCDEGAGKAVWSVKGASGLRPCMHCKNVVAVEEEAAGSLTSFDDQGYLVDIACSDATR